MKYDSNIQTQQKSFLFSTMTRKCFGFNIAFEVCSEILLEEI